MSSSDGIGLNIEQLECHIVVSVSYCDCDQFYVVTLCTLPSHTVWEVNLCQWLVEYWSVMLHDPVVVSGAFACCPSAERLCSEDSINQSNCVKSLSVEDMTKLVTQSVTSAFGGPAVDVLVTYLVSKLRDEVVAPVLDSCPKLRRVSIKRCFCDGTFSLCKDAFWM